MQNVPRDFLNADIKNNRPALRLNLTLNSFSNWLIHFKKVIARDFYNCLTFESI